MKKFILFFILYILFVNLYAEEQILNNDSYKIREIEANLQKYDVSVINREDNYLVLSIPMDDLFSEKLNK